MNESRSPKRTGSDLNIALTSGITLLAGMLVGYLGGRYLDGLAGTSPWLTLAGMVLGAAAGFRIVVRDILRGADGGQPGPKGSDGTPEA